jgi:serine/threonine-protein kinase
VPESVLFDRYELLSPAGRGGSAEVWRALDRETGDIVAVKRLHPVVFADAAARERLRRESAALEGLDEPHLVRVRDLRIGDREAVLVLDFVDGPTLADRLRDLASRDERMPPDEAVAVTGDVAAALGAAHAAGIVHRDVTPSNILLAADGSARLTDFGIAHTADDVTAVTAAGTLVGTLRYLAPEQLRGEPATAASDVHGLAAVTYEMLAGRPAYEAATPVALVDAQRLGPAPIPNVPRDVDSVVRAGLDPDPARRPHDVRSFAASVAAAFGSGALAAAPSAPTVAIPVPVPVPVPVPAHEASPVPRTAGGREPRPRAADAPRRVPAPVVAALVAVLTLGIVAAAGGLDSRRPSESREPSAPAAADPSRAVRVTPAPTAAPKDAKGHGKDHDEKPGKGKGKRDGGD